jgi:hypothetical protein
LRVHALGNLALSIIAVIISDLLKRMAFKICHPRLFAGPNFSHIHRF